MTFRVLYGLALNHLGCFSTWFSQILQWKIQRKMTCFTVQNAILIFLWRKKNSGPCFTRTPSYIYFVIWGIGRGVDLRSALPIHILCSGTCLVTYYIVKTAKARLQTFSFQGVGGGGRLWDLCNAESHLDIKLSCHSHARTFLWNGVGRECLLAVMQSMWH